MQPTEKFLRMVLPAAGNKAIVSIKQGTVRHYWFEPDDYAGAAKKAVELADAGLDAYYALGGFTGNERKSDKVAAVKAVWMDIDTGAGKDYATRTDAMQAFSTFLTATALPVPLIVSSGYGLHAYWIFNQDLHPAEWLALSNKLKELCRQHNMKADLKCTSDAARILRPIGTKNFKNGIPRTVKIANAAPITLDEQKVREVLGVTEGDVFAAMSAQMPEGAEVRDGGFASQPTADFDQILSKCATLRWAYENQDQVREPLWYDVLGVAGFCVGGLDAAHRVSGRHPEYDRSYTEKKLAQRIAAAGPTTCEQFRTDPAGQCATCKHKVTSPIVLGYARNSRPTSDSTEIPLTEGNQNASAPSSSLAKVNALTFQHFTDQNVQVLKNELRVKLPVGKLDEHGNQPWEWTRIAEYGIRPLLELRLPDATGAASNFVWMETYDHNLKPLTHFIVPSQGISNSQQFSTDCSKQGYYFESEATPAAYRKFHKIMRGWVEAMKKAQGAVVTFRSFGWTGPDNANTSKDSFLLGSVLYTPNGGTSTAPPIPNLAVYQSEIRSQGSLAEWTKAMDHYGDPGMEAYMFATWCAWGAPLMGFTNNGSILFHINGKSGHGKTSLQKAIISVYGEYDGKQLLDPNQSTLNSVGKTMGLFNSLPYCKEEVTDGDAQELATWALTVSQGREKGRMNQNLGIATASTWSTIGITSGNLSLRELIAAARQDSAARLARVYEQDVELPISQHEASRLFSPLRYNYGVAGPVYIRYLVDNRVAVAKRVHDMEEELTIKLNGQGEDRFVIGMFAANFIGAMIAVELGLIHHDVQRGIRYAISQFKRLRRSAAKEKRSCEENLAQFIQDMQPNTLVVEFDVPGTGNGSLDTDGNIVRNVALNNGVTMRYASKDGKFYATASLIRKYYVDNHLSFTSEMKELETAGILLDRAKRTVLTKGTKLSDGKQVICYMFDISKSKELMEVVK